MVLVVDNILPADSILLAGSTPAEVGILVVERPGPEDRRTCLADHQQSLVEQATCSLLDHMASRHCLPAERELERNCQLVVREGQDGLVRAELASMNFVRRRWVDRWHRFSTS